MTEETKKPEPKEEKPLSPLEETKQVLAQITKEKEELKEQNDRNEKFKSDELLSSTAGGHVEATQVSPEDAKKAAAKEFLKELN